MPGQIFDGAEMRRRRQVKEITPTQLGAAIDRCAETVAFYELGLRNPPLQVLWTICQALGCTPNDLVVLPVEEAS